MQFGVKKQLQIVQRLHIPLASQARAILLSLKNLCSCLFTPNCTRNRFITNTYHFIIFIIVFITIFYHNNHNYYHCLIYFSSTFTSAVALMAWFVPKQPPSPFL